MEPRELRNRERLNRRAGTWQDFDRMPEHDATIIAQDRDPDGIRNRADFKQLVAEIETKPNEGQRVRGDLPSASSALFAAANSLSLAPVTFG